MPGLVKLDSPELIAARVWDELKLREGELSNAISRSEGEVERRLTRARLLLEIARDELENVV